MTTITLERDTPARMLGLTVTLCAGNRLELGPITDTEGGGRVATCWAPEGRRGGPAALVPIAIAARYLPATR